MSNPSGRQLIIIQSSAVSHRKHESRILIRQQGEAGFLGRTLWRFYDALGNKVGSIMPVGSVAERRGKGPKFAADTIATLLTQERWEHASLADSSFPPEILSACNQLVQFAFRTQTPKTQLAAFRRIIAITTQFPGLKVLLEKSVPGPVAADALISLWDREDDASCDLRWHFFCELAASCIADRKIFPFIQGHSRVALASGNEQLQTCGLSFIERLIIASTYEPATLVPSHLSIRYLTGILALPHFWDYLRQEQTEIPRGQLYLGIALKLLKRARVLLQDLGLEHTELSSADDNSLLLPLEAEGADEFCQAILSGMEHAFLHDMPVPSAVGQPWYCELRGVVHLLWHHGASILVPKSQQQALSDVYIQSIVCLVEEREIEMEDFDEEQARDSHVKGLACADPMLSPVQAQPEDSILSTSCGPETSVTSSPASLTRSLSPLQSSISLESSEFKFPSQALYTGSISGSPTRPRIELPSLRDLNIQVQLEVEPDNHSDRFALENIEGDDVPHSLGDYSLNETVWPVELGVALLEGLERYKPGVLDGFPLRNRSISEYILPVAKTGKHRTPKQVGRRLQQLSESDGVQQLVPCLLLLFPPTPSAESGPTSIFEFDQVEASPGHTTMYIDILPTSRSLVSQSAPIPLVSGQSVLRASPQPRHIGQINPLSTFTSPALLKLSAHARLNVLSESAGLVLHAETVPLELLADAPESGDVFAKELYYYSARIVPRYWPVIVDSPDPTRFTIFQEIAQDDSAALVIFTARYRFRYPAPSSDQFSPTYMHDALPIYESLNLNTT
ncbi:TEA domain-containing protein [Mycena chlorophos]|uniref:TEA domain-containing protein n=1 Tax=Mycena chlorophos TaxID=658473 RepID=A0A8H6SR21_MYCCL|nr:TEA domain-containing protein [Mycena chlorophos]